MNNAITLDQFRANMTLRGYSHDDLFTFVSYCKDKNYEISDEKSLNEWNKLLDESNGISFLTERK